MKNLEISLPLVDGSELPMNFESGEELIEQFCGDDWGAPPRGLSLRATADDGRVVTIYIPNTRTNSVSVRIEDPA